MTSKLDAESRPLSLSRRRPKVSHPSKVIKNIFKGVRYEQVTQNGRTIRVSTSKEGVATTAYCYAMDPEERSEMARRITASLNLTTNLSIEQIESLTPLSEISPH